MKTGFTGFTGFIDKDGPVHLRRGSKTIPNAAASRCLIALSILFLFGCGGDVVKETMIIEKRTPPVVIEKPPVVIERPPVVIEKQAPVIVIPE